MLKVQDAAVAAGLMAAVPMPAMAVEQTYDGQPPPFSHPAPPLGS